MNIQHLKNFIINIIYLRQMLLDPMKPSSLLSYDNYNGPDEDKKPGPR